MGSGLYEAAFATLVRLYGQGARGAITGITLIAGFASTVGWPLSAWMEVQWGWRGACFGLGGAAPAGGRAAQRLAAARALQTQLHDANRGSAAAPPAPTTEPAVSATAHSSPPAARHRAAVLRVCGHLVHQHRHGSAPASAAAGQRHIAAGGSGPGGAGGPGAGGGAPAGVWPSAPLCTRCCRPSWPPPHTRWARSC